MRCLTIAATILLLCFGAAADTPLRIQISDPAGGAVETSGQLENLATGLSQAFRSNASGSATVTAVAEGRYRITISAPGFAPYRADVALADGGAATHNATLALARSEFSAEVVAITPLPGVEQGLNEIASPVQTATAADIADSGALGVTDFINRRLSGVNLNEIQGNPAQVDLSYRGYTASPLLGTPQGISIYMDGVRLNQPFGDSVAWDLIPNAAISDVTLIPGSNPLFGLNTLGGALSISTRDGHTSPGSALEVSGGSFGRKIASFEQGGANQRGLSWFLVGNMFFEDGWRDASPSNIRQYFGKLGWQGTKTTLSLTTSWANNHLNGNGLHEEKFLQRNYSGIYTKPDITATRSPFLNFTFRHSPSSSLTFSGNVYYRFISGHALNGDLNEGSLDQSVYQPSAADIRALQAAGYSGFPAAGATAANTPFPFWRCIAQALQKDEPGEKCNGLLNRTGNRQHNGGFSAQVSSHRSAGPGRNQFTAGGAFDRSSTGFTQSAQFAYMNPDRSFTGVPAFADGSSDVDGQPYDTRVNLDGHVRTLSAFFTDTFSAGRLHLTGSGRFNNSRIDNQDRIRPAGQGSLSGDHSYSRFNPGVGITFQAAERMNLYAGYSEGSRAPTAIELGCADPLTPCKLPNAMQGDPPLNQVTTRTVEAGVRGTLPGSVRWSSGFFSGRNSNDILFVASSQTGFGYFRNFGQTMRQGFDASLNSRWKRLTAGMNYTFLSATYESAETVQGTANSTNDLALRARGLEGNIRITPGNHIPLIPRQMAKAWADVAITTRLTLDLNANAIGSAFARGNENNAHRPDGVYYLGAGKSPGYVVVNLAARYRVNRFAELFIRANNILDRKYYSAAQLGVTGFTPAGTFIARPLPAVNGEFPLIHATFLAPGAPAAVFGGLRLRF